MNDFADRIAGYLDGSMDAEARSRFEADLLQDESLAQAVYRELGVRDALGEPDPTLDRANAPRRSPARSRSRAWLRWFVPAAAMAAAFAIWMRPGTPVDPTDPDVTRGNGAGVSLLTPDFRAVSAPSTFTWASVAGANAYRLEVFDAEFDVVVHTIVGDTVWSAVDVLPAVLDGTWRIVALRDGREIDRSSMRALRYP